MKKLLLLTFVFVVGILALAQTPDPTKHPHYFGPYPNWANSPLTTVDATVQFGDGCGTGATAVASVDQTGAITGITVTSQGSGYICAPPVTILTTYGDGAATAHATLTTTASGYLSAITLVNPGSNYFYPIVTITGDGTGATADATIDPYTGAIIGITLTSPGSGYTSASVAITDWGGTGSGASATATVAGTVLAVVVDTPGSGYKTPGGLRKFVDTLPGLGPQNANNLGQYISVANPDTVTYPGSDYYEISLVEYTKQLHSDLPATGTKLRGYVQENYGTDPATGLNTVPPDLNPQYLGATIVARKDRPVRILFKNKLPVGEGGNLFLPVDTTIMGSGMGPGMGGMTETNNNSVFDGVRNPMCGMPGMKPADCFTENRATLHLHGGNSPWISDGTPHQWTAPAGEMPYPDGSGRVNKGVSVSYVPDMWFDASGNPIAECAGQTTCSVSGASNDPGAGALTFYYTNQQSARLLFYHDHAWGITRLNVYAGEAAGYVITDNTEQALMAPGAPLADVGLGVPLIIQDRTFVPETNPTNDPAKQFTTPYGIFQSQLHAQDPTWDLTRWGNTGDFWYHHVYMPAQNPADPTGVSPYGRWMFGPWFWPPATPLYPPIPNPYYDAACDPATAPNGFCEPPTIPGTPNISVGMEQFNDTPLVNGTAYPTLTVQPKGYRFRILNAANDRFFNLQWYVADGSGTEVALKPAEVAAAQNDPTVFPTPDTTISPAGPKFVQIGSEGGFLPTPVVIDNQPITWITDPTRFDVGNVDKHALLLAPAERADVIVDFSAFAGKTLILYNDAPAAFPARVASYDYYTGHPDNSDVGGSPTTIPGYGPNTRTVMQVKVDSTGTATTFNLAALVAAFQHTAIAPSVFESGQHPIIVGQAGYNKAYGKTFTSSGFCSSPTATNQCDGFARIQQQGGDPFTFDALAGQKLSITLQPKALHDEMNAVAFDEFGRMTANIGVEAVPATPNAQNVTLYPYVNPATEIIDATRLPLAPLNGVEVTPITVQDDGTQIWKITHNGVDTHPIHFHLFDVQVLNRVTWDNIIIPPDFNELGWKDTVRVSPLEDTLVALRPIIPSVPFDLPNSIRLLNPMVPAGSGMGFNNFDANGNPTTPIVNQLVNFGWEYVWHCHILSHEEMDMMRPVTLAVPPKAPDGLSYSTTTVKKNSTLTLTWNDNSVSETAFVVQRMDGTAGTWVDVGTVASPLDQPNTTGLRTFTDTGFSPSSVYQYRVVAQNTVGYGGAFMSYTVQSVSNSVTYAVAAPSGLTATLQAGPQVRLTWTDNAANETGFVIERAVDGGAFVQIATAPARTNTGSVSYIDATVSVGHTYSYRVAAVNTFGQSNYSNSAQVVVDVPQPPSLVSVTAARQGNNDRVTLTWTAVANATSYTVQRSTTATFDAGTVTAINVAGGATGSYVDTVPRGTPGVTTYWYRILAVNVIGPSAPSNVLSVVTQ